VAMRAQPSSSANTKKNKVESLAQLDKLEKNERDTSKDKQLAFAVFAALTPHRQPSPKNGLRHFSALPTRHPTSGRDNKILLQSISWLSFATVRTPTEKNENKKSRSINSENNCTFER